MSHFELFEDIESVFPEISNLGPWPTVVVDDDFCERQGILGRYQDGKIYIKSTTDRLTLTHEIGHWVYAILFERETENHDAGTYRGGTILELHWRRLAESGSQTAIGMLGFFAKAKQTRAYELLESLIEQKPNNDNLFYQWTLLSLSENWANAFAQSFALKQRNDTELQEALHANFLECEDKISLWETNGYWPPCEFIEAGIFAEVQNCLVCHTSGSAR